MRERPNRHAWKACEGKPSEGSNPSPSARGHHRAAQLSLSGRVGGSPAARPDTAWATVASVPASAPLDHHVLMAAALEEARAAEVAGEVPVGAVVVVGGEVVARAHNRREATCDPSAHAEILALRDACEANSSWRLPGATVVVTLEPCTMCAGALSAARIERVVFGAADPKAGALGSLYNVGVDPRLPHTFDVVAGIDADECGAVLESFFASRR